MCAVGGDRIPHGRRVVLNRDDPQHCQSWYDGVVQGNSIPLAQGEGSGMKYILMNKYMDVTLNISLKKKLENHLLCQYPFRENLGLKFFNDSSRDYRMSTEASKIYKFLSKKRSFPCVGGPTGFRCSASLCAMCDSISIKLLDSFHLPALENFYVRCKV